MKCTPANKAILIYGLPAPPSSGRQIYIMIKDSITQSTTNQTLWRLKIKLNAIFQLFGIIVMFYNFKNELGSNARGKVNHASEVIYQAYHSRIRRSALLLRLEEKKRIGEKKLVESKSFC